MESNDGRCNLSDGQIRERELIRNKYIAVGQSRMARLQELERLATRRSRVAAAITGVISAYFLGAGLCCVVFLGELSSAGIVLSLVGAAGLTLTYPLYALLSSRERKKLEPEISALNDELLEDALLSGW